MLDTIAGGALFLRFFPKTPRKRELFKARKRIEVSAQGSAQNAPLEIFDRVISIPLVLKWQI